VCIINIIINDINVCVLIININIIIIINVLILLMWNIILMILILMCSNIDINDIINSNDINVKIMKMILLLSNVLIIMW